MNDTLAQGDAIVSDFKNLRGQDALNAQQATQAKLNQIVAAGRANLSTPEQQLQFDQQVRPYQQRYWSGQMSQHSNQQGADFATATNTDAYRLAVSRASNVADDPEELKHAMADALGARVKQLKFEGLGNNQDAYNEADAQAGRDVYKTAAAAIAVKDPVRAQQFVETNKALLGPEYAALADGLKAKAEQQGGADLFKTSLQGTQGQQSATPSGPPSNAPLPPVRGNGGPAPATSISDSTALAAQNRLNNGGGTDADRATLETYRQQQNTPKDAAPAAAAGAPAPPAPTGKMPTPYELAGARSRVAVGPGDAEDKAWIARADAPGGTTSTPAAAGPEVTGRSATPVASQRLPANPIVDPNDRSHSLPAPTPGGAALPYFSQAGAPYGISGNYLARTWQLEGGGKLHPGTSSAGAEGAFQFIPSTWARYGNGGNPNDFGSATMASVRLGADNRTFLTKSLGRSPSDAELYLAHQQGASGATTLLQHPNMPAADALALVAPYNGNRARAAKAISGNGGNPDAPASAFSSMWINKFNGTKGATGPLPMFASSPGFAPGGYAASTDPEAPPVMPDSIASPVASPISASQSEAAEPTLMQQAAPATQVPPPAPVEQEQPQRSPEADVYARIEASGASDQVKAHAFAQAHQYFAEQKVATEQDQNNKKDRSERVNGTYTARVLNGDVSPQILSQVANDPNLLPETKWTLTRAIREESTRAGGGDKDAKTYGPGFYKALQGVTADRNDPNRIGDVNEIWRRAGPGGDLTFEGANKLVELKRQGERTPNDAAVNSTRASLLKYAHGEMSFDDPDHFMPDKKGETLFNGTFVPKFEAAYDQWIKDGKNPWDFLTQDNVDKLRAGIRPKGEMEADRVAAEKGGPAEASPDSTTATAATPTASTSAGAPAAVASALPAGPLPSAPAEVDPLEWKNVIENGPASPGGNRWPLANWASVISTLRANPTPGVKALFNQRFGSAGFNADAVLAQLKPPSTRPIALDDPRLGSE